MKFFISLLDLLVQGLVLNLQLLEVDQVKTVCQLLLLFEYLLFVGESVPEGNVLESKLIDLLVLLELGLLLPLDEISRDLLACAGIHRVLRHTTFQLLELGLDLLALGLFLIKFGLQLRRHLIVSILGLLEVETHLMHVGKCIQVLVLIHLLSIGFGMLVTSCLVGLLFVDGGFHEHNLTLKLLIVTLEGFLFAEGLLNSHDQLTTQLLLLIQIGDLVNSITVIIIVHISVIILSS